MHMGLSREALDKFKSHDIYRPVGFVVLRGTLHYRDVFRKVHEVQWCWVAGLYDPVENCDHVVGPQKPDSTAVDEGMPTPIPVRT